VFCGSSPFSGGVFVLCLVIKALIHPKTKKKKKKKKKYKKQRKTGEH
jgi:hypothetical protein